MDSKNTLWLSIKEFIASKLISFSKLFNIQPDV